MMVNNQEKTDISNTKKWLLVTGSWLVYIVVFSLAFSFFGPLAAALAILPAALTAWLLGIWGGLAAGLIAFPLNFGLLNVFGSVSIITLIPEGGLGYLLILFVGIGVGWLRTLIKKLEVEVANRIRIEKNLEEEKLKVQQESEGLANRFESVELVNENLEKTKKAMLNLLEDSKKLEATLAEQTEELRKEKMGVELKVQERTKELQDAQGKLQASINSLNVGFVMTDTEYNVVNINSTAKRILCINDFKTVIRDPSGIGSNCSLEDIEDNLKNVVDLRQNIKKCLEERNIINIDDISFNNRILHFFLSPIALYRQKLDIIGVVILVEDVTEARILARSKDEFFSIASHELRTPLTAIRGNTALMKDYYFDKIEDKDLKVMISDIHESSVRLIQIVNDFLDTSRLEQGRIDFHNEDFDLPTVIEEVIKELEPNLAASELYLKLKPSNVPIPLVIADRDRVKQILINLIGNAIKFTKEGGITLALIPSGTAVKISITDTGKGLTPESKNLLFRKFQQAEDNILTRDATRGTGLGLYISKLLVEGMGGRIYLESSHESKGSTFSFELPAVAKTEVIAPSEEVKQKKRVFKSRKTSAKKKVAKK